MYGRKLTLFVATAASLAMCGQANAQSAAAATGIVAGLGLAPATGKTTLGSGAGGIEASLLVSDAILAAGTEIHDRANSVAGGSEILVLGAADSVNLAAAVSTSQQIDQLQDELYAACPLEKPVRPRAAALQPSLTDIPAVLATDRTYSSISLTTNDRLLVSAVANPTAANWSPVGTKTPGPLAAATGSTFVVPTEINGALPNSDVLVRYHGRVTSANHMTNVSQAGHCDPDPAKAAQDVNAVKTAVSDIATFVKTVSTASQGQGQAPITLAAEFYPIALKNPLVLRVSIEQVGGTSVVRANIWYTLGLPGSATVAAGLLASYRLVDPVTGAVKATGLVRCMTKQANLDNVQGSLAKDASDKVCEAAPS